MSFLSGIFDLFHSFWLVIVAILALVGGAQ